MKKLKFLFYIIPWLYANQFYAQSGNLHIGSGAFVKISGNATLKLNDTNWQNDGAFAAGNSTVEFQGGTATGGRIAGNQPTIFNHLAVNRSGLSVKLDKQVQVNGNLTFTAGTLDLNGNDLTLGPPNGLIVNETETNRIVGSNGGEVVLVTSLNNPSQVNPGNIGVRITSAATLGVTTVRRGHVPKALSSIGSGVARYYNIQPANNSSLNATLRFAYFDTELNGISESNLSLYREKNGAWQTGSIIGTGTLTRDAAQNLIQQSGIDQIIDNWTLAAACVIPADAGPDQRICAGNNVALTATGGQTYRWDDGSTNATLQFAPLTSGFKFVTVTDANGCSAKDSVRVDVNPVPDVNPASDQTVCNGQMTQEILHTGSVPGTTFNGTNNMPSIGLGASATNVVKIAPFTAINTGNTPVVASVTVTPVLTNAGVMCVGKPDTFTITVNPSPNANISGPSSVCAGGNIDLIASGGNTFLWSVGSTRATITVTAATTYTVTVTGVGGCTDTATKTVSNLPAPTPKLGPTGLFGVCAGDSLVLNPGVFSAYRWSTSATTATVKVPSKDNLYVVTVTDANGCTATATANVTELARTVAKIAVPDTLDCVNAQVTLDGTGSSSGIFFSAAWSATNGNIVSGGNTLKPVVDKPGVYQLIVTGPSTTCPNTATVTVIEQKQTPADVALSLKDASCVGQTDGLVAIGKITSGLPPFAFSLNGGTFLSGVDTFKNLAAGDYTLTIQGRNGCFLIKNFTIKEGKGPVPNLGNDQTVCPGTSAIFKAGPFTGYQWSNGESVTQITVSTPGLYTVTVKDAIGCTGTDVVELKNHPDVIARATVADSLTCLKAQIALGSSGSSTGANIRYAWTTADGKIDGVTNTPNPTVSEGGTYQLIVRNAQTTCADTAKVTVVETGKPVTNIDLKTNDLRCFGSEDGVIAVNAVGSGTAPFTYRLDNGPFQSGGTFDNLSPGAYLLTVRGADGCEATGKAEIDEPDALAVSVKSPGILQGGASAALVATVSGAQGDVRYQWEGPDLSCADCAEPDISPKFNASYMLTVTDEKGCTAVANVLVPVKSDLGPDVITPGNEDGQNDKLVFDDLDKEPAASENDIIIFNRWGQKVFATRRYKNDWKGTDDEGRELPEGTYYYVLNLRDGIKNAVHGSVLIVR